MTGPDKIWINWTPTDGESPPSMVAAAVLPKYLKHIDHPVEYTRTAAHPVTVEVQNLINAAVEQMRERCVAACRNFIANNWPDLTEREMGAYNALLALRALPFNEEPKT